MRRALVFSLAFLLVAGVQTTSSAGSDVGYQDQYAGSAQVSPVTNEGKANLVHHWIEDGGARLHWKSVQTPKQVRLAGSEWTDPASVSLSQKNERAVKAKRGKVKRTAKKTSVQSKSAKKKTIASAKKNVRLGKAPVGVGRTSLKAPKKTSKKATGTGQVREPLPTTYTNINKPQVSAQPLPPPMSPTSPDGSAQIRPPVFR